LSNLALFENPAMLVDSAVHLVERLRNLSLLNPEQLAEVDSFLAIEFPDSGDLAGQLLERGWLTQYQVCQLIGNEPDSELVVGPHILLERLGEGGMGQVFKARDRSQDRIIALKIINERCLGEADVLRRFNREARAASALDHLNVVRAFSADQADGLHFITMEYVEGIDLMRLVEQRGPLPPSVACDVARQAALGLQHASERGFVHRDIKPANLLLTKDHVVKVLDMGLARLQHGFNAEQASALTMEGSMLGTPDFVSPEQARDARGVDIRADLYSLGCTLYFLLTGEVPFPGGSLTEKLLKHVLSEATPVQKLRPEVPTEVVAVLRRLMAKRPEDRYQTPAEAAKALARAATAAPPADLGKVTCWRPRTFHGSQGIETEHAGPSVVAESVVEVHRSALRLPASFPGTEGLATAPPVAGVDAVPTSPRSRRGPWIAVALVGVASVGLTLFLWRTPTSPSPAPRAATGRVPSEAQLRERPTSTDPDPIERAIAALRKLGARVVLDEALPGVPVVEVSLADRKITDADLTQIEPLTQLRVLDVASTGVTDAGLKHLEGLSRINSLNLSGCPVTDAGLSCLRSLSQLSELDLSRSRTTNAGLKHLEGLTRLRYLILIGTEVTDAGLSHLERLTQLEELHLVGTRVNGTGLRHLKNLVTLRLLDLRNTEVTDASLQALHGLTTLNEIRLNGTRVSGQAIQALQHSLPKMKIEH
jgi:serine/threonine protein kinase